MVLKLRYDGTSFQPLEPVDMAVGTVVNADVVSTKAARTPEEEEYYRNLPKEPLCPWNPELTREKIDELIAEGGWMTTAEVMKFAGMT